jgi:hypothetical protein
VSEERIFFCSSEMLSNHYKNEILVLKGEFTNLFIYSDLMLVKQVKLSLVCWDLVVEKNEFGPLTIKSVFN